MIHYLACGLIDNGLKPKQSCHIIAYVQYVSAHKHNK